MGVPTVGVAGFAPAAGIVVYGPGSALFWGSLPDCQGDLDLLSWEG